MTQAPAAGNTVTAIDPTALLGDWRLTRRLVDRQAGRSGTVYGQLTLRSEGAAHIAWAEQGTLLWNGSRLPVSRSYRLLRAEDGWWLYFPDGRSFHAWTPGQWVYHPCREDSYRGLITIAGPDRWRTLWEVDGPDKAQRIITWLSRSTALGEQLIDITDHPCQLLFAWSLARTTPTSPRRPPPLRRSSACCSWLFRSGTTRSSGRTPCRAAKHWRSPLSSVW